MMISRAEIGVALRAYRSARREGRPPPRLPLSAVARAWLRWSAPCRRAAAGCGALGEPFYRHGRVAELRARIAAGRYEVTSEEIAEKLLGRLIVDAAAAG